MVYVRVLGTAQIEAGALRITPATPRKFAFLLVLAGEAGRRVSRSRICDLVYPDIEKNPQHSLRDLIYQLRRDGIEIVSQPDGVGLPGGSAQTDWERFIRDERRSPSGLPALEAGILPDYPPETFDALSAWVSAYRDRVSVQVSRALVDDINRARSAGDWRSADEFARACLALDPLNEEATLAIAEGLAFVGSKARAMHVLDDYSKELGTDRSELKLPAAVVRRRITERMRDTYKAPQSLPFLGRDQEMASLCDRLERARRGESQSICLIGDAGIGKTRLAQEFCAHATLAGCRVEKVVMQPHDLHRPMGVFSDLVPRLLELPGSLGCDPSSLEALRRLTEPTPAEEHANAANAEVVAVKISRAIADLVDAVGAESTLVVFVDDVQWTDDLSRRTLADLVAAKSARRLVVVMTSRDRSVVQFFARHAERLSAVAMQPLGETAVTELLDKAFNNNDDALDDELQAWIADTSGGNPFFLRCLIGHYETTRERFVVPTTVSSLLDQHVAALSPEATSLLGMSVAFGRYATVARLTSALEMPFFQIQRAVQELETSFLISNREGRVDPAHWLVSEAVRRSTPPMALRLCHGRAATVLEGEFGSEGASTALWDCAEHWIAAGEPQRATQLLERCALRSVAIGRPREAAELLIRAGAMIDGQGRSHCLRLACEISGAANEFDVFLIAVDLADRLGSRIEYDAFAITTARALVSQHTQVNTAAEQLRSWLQPQFARVQRVQAGLHTLILADQANDATHAHATYASLYPDGVDVSNVSDREELAFLLIYHSSFGDVEASLVIAKRLLEYATDAPPVIAADLRRKSAIAFWRAGNVGEATAAFDDAHATAKAAGLQRLQYIIASMMVGIAHDIGDDSLLAIWQMRMDEITDLVPEFLISVNHTMLLGDIACASRDREGIRRALTSALGFQAANPSVRGQRWATVFRAAADADSIFPADIHERVDELLRSHRVGSEAGDLSDSEAAAAATLYIDARKEGLARDVVERYVATYRRPGAPLGRWLRVVMEKMGLPPVACRSRTAESAVAPDTGTPRSSSEGKE